MNTNDEIDLAIIGSILWMHKLQIIGVAAVCGILAAVVSLTITPIFRAEVVVTEVQDEGLGGSAAMLNQLGGLASLAGIKVGAGGGTDPKVRAILESRFLAEEFSKRNNVAAILFPDSKQPVTLWLTVKEFRDNVFSLSEDVRKGRTTISMKLSDPVLAAQWANGYVALANEVIRARALEDASRNIAYLKAQIAKTSVVEIQRVMYSLIESQTKTEMLASARAEYAFAVVDPAVPPEIRVSPKRTLIVVAAAVAGGGVALMFALFRTFLARGRSRALAGAGK